MTRDRLATALATCAARWSDPDYSVRALAAEQSVSGDNRFTEEAVAFAINQQMSLVTIDALRAWMPDTEPTVPRKVGVVCAGNVPFADLQDFLAVLLSGHTFLGKLSSKSPYLLQAFADDLAAELGMPLAAFVDLDRLLTVADALVATGSDRTVAAMAEAADRAGIPRQNRLLRGHGFGVALLDGTETDDECSCLAEDLLLHEGMGCRNVAVVWAPTGTSPDRYLDIMSQFRSVFPPSPRTLAALKMPEAFLVATRQSHAAGPGFLVSKGPPEPQVPGHIRWSEYASLDEVTTWLSGCAPEIQVLVASTRMEASAPFAHTPAPFGTAQRPELDWRPGGHDVMAFLRDLA